MDKKTLKLQSQTNKIVEKQINILEPMIIQDDQNLLIQLQPEQQLNSLMRQLAKFMKSGDRNVSSKKSKQIQTYGQFQFDTYVLLQILQQKSLIKINRNNIHINTESEAEQQKIDQIQLNVEDNIMKNKDNTYFLKGRGKIEGLLHCGKVNIEVWNTLEKVDIQKILLCLPCIKDLFIFCKIPEYFDRILLAVRELLPIYPEFTVTLRNLRLYLTDHILESNLLGIQSKDHKSQFFQFILIFPQLRVLELQLNHLNEFDKLGIIKIIPFKFPKIKTFILKHSTIGINVLENLFRAFELNEEEHGNYLENVEFYCEHAHFLRSTLSVQIIINQPRTSQFEYDIDFKGEVNQDNVLIQRQKQLKKLSYNSDAMQTFSKMLYLLPEFLHLQRIDFVYTHAEGDIQYLYPLLNILPRIKKISIEYQVRYCFNYPKGEIYSSLINNHIDQLKSFQICQDKQIEFSYKVQKKCNKDQEHIFSINSDKTELILRIHRSSITELQNLVLEVLKQQALKFVNIKLILEEGFLIQDILTSINSSLCKLQSQPSIKITIEYIYSWPVKTLTTQVICDLFRTAANNCSYFTLNIMLQELTVNFIETLVNDICKLNQKGRLILKLNQKFWGSFSINQIIRLTHLITNSEIVQEIGLCKARENQYDPLEQQCILNIQYFIFKQLNYLIR